MAGTIISLNDATIDTEVFRHYNQEAQTLLRNIEVLQQEFKELLETVENTTGIKKTEVAGYFKSRFTEKHEDVVAKGNLYEVLNEALN